MKAAILRLLALAALLAIAAPAAAQPSEAAFQAWIAGPLRAEAAARGVSAAVFDRAFAGVRPDLLLPDLEGSPVQHQTEFGRPARYFDEGRIERLVGLGRRHAAEWEGTLKRVEAAYGVPGAILLAIWARESDFGAARLPHDAVTVLATEAFYGRRKEAFRTELLAALEILQRGDIGARQMRSSWAGALGQPQFLPSQFLRYAVDFDGDGRRDIWDSVPDSLASMANYLRQEGWQPGTGWGIEASVPAAVSCALEGPEQGRPAGQWAALGVAAIGGGWPSAAVAGQTRFLMMPAGRYGPAFVVTPNFYVLKAYNNSDLYALYVGHLADRFGSNRGFAGAWGDIGGFDRRDVERMQRALVAAGYDVGGVDGLVGFRTRIAIGLWQARNGLPVTCFPDAAFLRRF